MTRERETELVTQRDMEKRVHQLALHMNHVERSQREFQWQKLAEKHESEAEQQAIQTQEMATRELEEAKSRHEQALLAKARTERIKPELVNYLTDLMARVDQDFSRWAQKERTRVAEIQAKEEEERLERKREEEREAKEAERAAIAKEAEEEAQRVAAEAEEKERLRAETGGKYRPGAMRAGRTGAGVMPPTGAMPPTGPPGVAAGGDAPSSAFAAKFGTRANRPEPDSREAAFKSFGSSRRDLREGDGAMGKTNPSNGISAAPVSGRRPRFINSKKT
eukprot:Plantae.Rhodophyta-Palmaria_palmata.ctg932.p1 GENE.Plantae.Rhodophyta-Palmaria_palmata.ctg932~~Plantae.Rhodophyta-Palmaria_palmata.ctg932.p1  ORF type:complete len:278 (+),score=65.12 Plantae.Rhodophyta-Palmaria_palmata.ctg932:341-1174(+)